MTRLFVSAKRLIRYFSNSSKLFEHRAQSPVCEVSDVSSLALYRRRIPNRNRGIEGQLRQIVLLNLICQTV